jgi:hypothetical protein
MFFRILATRQFWTMAVRVTFVAIPLVMAIRKEVARKALVPAAGDDSDIFDGELSPD